MNKKVKEVQEDIAEVVEANGDIDPLELMQLQVEQLKKQRERIGGESNRLSAQRQQINQQLGNLAAEDAGCQGAISILEGLIAQIKGESPEEE